MCLHPRCMLIRDIRLKVSFIWVILTLHVFALLTFTLCKSDVIIGFDFAPLVYQEDDRTGKLKVDMTLRNDVIEQQKGRGEDLISGTIPLNDRSEQLSSLRTRGTSSIFKKSIFRSISKWICCLLFGLLLTAVAGGMEEISQGEVLNLENTFTLGYPG